MNDQDENLDLLDLDDNGEVDTLPEAAPFSVPRPKRPWLLMALGVAVIVLATWIIIARVGGDSGTSLSVDLDAPVVSVDVPVQPVADLNVPPKPVDAAPKPMPDAAPRPVEAPKPMVEPKPVVAPVPENNGAPIRVIEDRKEVTFNPDAPVAKPVEKPKAKPAPVVKPVKKITPPATKPVATATNGNIYVQFGSYSTRELANAAEHKIRASHQSLFSGKQFVILAAEVNGKTIYRLRIAFNSNNDANGFCRNAKSDGLDCYVTK